MFSVYTPHTLLRAWMLSNLINGPDTCSFNSPKKKFTDFKDSFIYSKYNTCTYIMKCNKINDHACCNVLHLFYWLKCWNWQMLNRHMRHFSIWHSLSLTAHGKKHYYGFTRNWMCMLKSWHLRIKFSFLSFNNSIVIFKFQKQQYICSKHYFWFSNSVTWQAWNFLHFWIRQ